MRRIAFLIIVYGVCLHLALVAVLTDPRFVIRLARRLAGPTLSQEEYYEWMVAYHRREDPFVPEGAVIFIGDSFIQGMCVSAVADKGVNFGIGGDTTVGVLQRLPMYTCMERSRAIVLSVGYNDLRARDNCEIISNYRMMLSRIPEGVPVLLCSVVPVADRCGCTESNRRIAEVNRSAAELCGSTKNCLYVDMGKHLTGPDGNISANYYEDDGIHLSRRGYRVWNEALQTRLLHVEQGVRGGGYQGAAG